jgi:hypothetical protein
MHQSAEMELNSCPEDELLERMLEEAEALASKMLGGSSRTSHSVKSTRSSRTSHSAKSTMKIDERELVVQADRGAEEFNGKMRKGGSTKTGRPSMETRRKSKESLNREEHNIDDVLRESDALLRSLRSSSSIAASIAARKSSSPETPTSVYILPQSNLRDDVSSVGSSSLRVSRISSASDTPLRPCIPLENKPSLANSLNRSNSKSKRVSALTVPSPLNEALSSVGSSPLRVPQVSSASDAPLRPCTPLENQPSLADSMNRSSSESKSVSAQTVSSPLNKALSSVGSSSSHVPAISSASDSPLRPCTPMDNKLSSANSLNHSSSESKSVSALTVPLSPLNKALVENHSSPKHTVVPDFTATSPNAKWEKVMSASVGDDDYVPIADYSIERRRKAPETNLKTQTATTSRLAAYRGQERRKRERRQSVAIALIVATVGIGTHSFLTSRVGGEKPQNEPYVDLLPSHQISSTSGLGFEKPQVYDKPSDDTDAAEDITEWLTSYKDAEEDEFVVGIVLDIDLRQEENIAASFVETRGNINSVQNDEADTAVSWGTYEYEANETMAKGKNGVHTETIPSGESHLVDTLSSANGDALVEDEADRQASESVDLVVKEEKMVDTLSSVDGDALVEDEADCQASESIDLVLKEEKGNVVEQSPRCKNVFLRLFKKKCRVLARDEKRARAGGK